MVRPGGFEPPTSWFVAMRSIQLIYGRTPKRAAHPAKPPPPLQVDFPFNPKTTLRMPFDQASYSTIEFTVFRKAIGISHPNSLARVMNNP